MQRIALLAILALALSSPAAAAERNILLAKIRIEKYLEGFHPYSCGDMPPGRECVVSGGYQKIRVRILNVYAGDFRQKYYTAWIGLGAFPDLSVPGNRLAKLYVVGELNGAGELQVLIWEYTFAGFCFADDNDARRLGIEAAVRDLKAADPCR